MSSLNTLKKQELLDLAKNRGVSVNSKMTKQDLIDKLTILDDTVTAPSNISDSTKTSKVAKTMSTKEKPTPKNNPAKIQKIAPPTKNIISEFDNNITVLMQSNHKALIIWNANPTDDTSIKAWKFQNSSGLDILVPSYVRSIFIDTLLLNSLSFTIYKVHFDDTKELFQQYNQELSKSYKDNPMQQAMFDPCSIQSECIKPFIDQHLGEYNKYKNNSSENYMDNNNHHGNSSSEQYFLLKNKGRKN